MTYTITFTQGSGPCKVTYRNLNSEAEAREKFLNDSGYGGNPKTEIVSITSTP